MKKTKIVLTMTAGLIFLLNIIACSATVSESHSSESPRNEPESGISDDDPEDDYPDNPYDDEYLTVTFDTDGLVDIPAQTVKYGECAEKPKDPVKEGYRFAGWYPVFSEEYWASTYHWLSESECEEPFNFEDSIYHDVTFKARWYLMYELKTGNILNDYLEYYISGLKFMKAKKAPSSDITVCWLDLAEEDIPGWYDSTENVFYYFIPEGKKTYFESRFQ